MRVTREDAQKIADTLKLHPMIRGVELFGSILRNGSGHDADLVLLVDSDVARKWWNDMRINLLVRMGTSLQPLRRCIKRFLPWLDAISLRRRKAHRIAYASDLLGVDFAAFGGQNILDIFLLPEDWRSGSELHVDALRGFGILEHNKTHLFLQSMARQATRIS